MWWSNHAVDNHRREYAFTRCYVLSVNGRGQKAFVLCYEPQLKCQASCLDLFLFVSSLDYWYLSHSIVISTQFSATVESYNQPKNITAVIEPSHINSWAYMFAVCVCNLDYCEKKKRNFFLSALVLCLSSLSLLPFDTYYVFVRVVLHSKTNVSKVNEYLFISALNRFVAPSSFRLVGWCVRSFSIPFILSSFTFVCFTFCVSWIIFIFSKLFVCAFDVSGNSHHNTFNPNSVLLLLLGSESFIVVIAAAASVNVVVGSVWNLFLFWPK